MYIVGIESVLRLTSIRIMDGKKGCQYMNRDIVEPSFPCKMAMLSHRRYATQYPRKCRCIRKHPLFIHPHVYMKSRCYMVKAKVRFSLHNLLLCVCTNNPYYQQTPILNLFFSQKKKVLSFSSSFSFRINKPSSTCS